MIPTARNSYSPLSIASTNRCRRNSVPKQSVSRKTGLVHCGCPTQLKGGSSATPGCIGAVVERFLLIVRARLHLKIKYKSAALCRHMVY